MTLLCKIQILLNMGLVWPLRYTNLFIVYEFTYIPKPT